MTTIYRLLTVATILSIATTPKVEAQERNDIRLELSITADRTEYRFKDRISINLKLTNVGDVPVFVYENIDHAGMFGGFTINVYDANGNEINPEAVIEAPFPLRINENQLIKIMPRYFYGIVITDMAKDLLFVKRPGRYEIVIKYRSPVTQDLWRDNRLVWRNDRERLTARTTVTIVP